MDDFEKSIQKSLEDPKFSYVHNSLLSMGYKIGEFPSDLIYKLGDEYEKNSKQLLKGKNK